MFLLFAASSVISGQNIERELNLNSGQTIEGLQHLRRAAAGSDAEVRDAALDALRQLGLSR